MPASKTVWDGRFLRLPLVGDLLTKIEVARFARTLGTLLGNGIPLLAALASSRKRWATASSPTAWARLGNN